MAKTIERCAWAGNDPLYVRYHDSEWGVPQTDDRALFEKLILEGFQAGLSWITILRKRDHFRKVFDGFDPHKIARYSDRKLAKLMADPGIIRNKAKISASVSNARAFLKLSERQSLTSFIWDFVDGKPIVNECRTLEDVPAQTEISKAMSKALKSQGFRFVGPTTAYAFMQSMGLVNDHVIACPRHSACARLQRACRPPTR